MAGQPFQFPELYPNCTCIICKRVGAENYVAPTIFKEHHISPIGRQNICTQLTQEEYDQIITNNKEAAEWLLQYMKDHGINL